MKAQLAMAAALTASVTFETCFAFTTTAGFAMRPSFASFRCVALSTKMPSSSASPFASPIASPTAAAIGALSMANLDPVTYLRTEWVSAALCTNQTPRSADVCLQLGSEDGRVVNFVPRTIRQIITSSAEKRGEGLSVSTERSLRQMADRRKSATIKYSNQSADDLVDTPSNSVDVVISLQAAETMHRNGLDWKKSILEAGRVLKPGGRFLFVESEVVGSGDAGGGEGYLDYVMSLSMDGMEEEENAATAATATTATDAESDEDTMIPPKPTPIFQEVGFDNVDMVLQPHIAGVAIKAMDADLSPSERMAKKSQEEADRLAEMSIEAFERGNKRRKRKKDGKKEVGAAGLGEEKK